MSFHCNAMFFFSYQLGTLGVYVTSYVVNDYCIILVMCDGVLYLCA